ncbi:MAG: pyridoxal-phosphate dependent enzyme [Alphaproteobacteria bacterium]
MADLSFLNGLETFYKDEMAPLLRRTPLIKSSYFSKKFGCNLYFKLENIQHTGSFKVRGALSKALSIPEADRKNNFSAASAGNHGLGVSYSAKALGVKAQIYMPKVTPNYKIRKIVELGGEPIIAGNDWDSSNVFAIGEAKKTKTNYFHPFSDEDVIRGQATIALEVLEDLPETDMFICSIGGGGLISGIATYAKSKNPGINVYGVETKGTDSMAQSLAKGERIELPEITSQAESIAVKEVTELTFNLVKEYVDGVYVVDDEEAFIAQKDILQQEKQLAEPAMSCCIAALEKGLVPDIKGKNVVVIMCGANYPVEKLAKTLQGSALVSYKMPRETMVRKLKDMGISFDEKSPEFEEFMTDIQEKEIDGYGYDETAASLELLARRKLNPLPDFFDILSFRVFDERRINASGEHVTVSEAALKIRFQEDEIMTVAESLAGPVSALDTALRKALVGTYPAIEDVKLIDYKVRILNPHSGTKATTRVTIECRNEKTDETWVTLGVSPNIIDASYQALQDAIIFHLLKVKK